MHVYEKLHKTDYFITCLQYLSGFMFETYFLYCVSVYSYLWVCFLNVRVTKHWERLPWEFVECPALNIFERNLEMYLGNWL